MSRQTKENLALIVMVAVAAGVMIYLVARVFV